MLAALQQNYKIFQAFSEAFVTLRMKTAVVQKDFVPYGWELNLSVAVKDNRKYFCKCIGNNRRTKQNLNPLLDVEGNIQPKDEEKADVILCLCFLTDHLFCGIEKNWADRQELGAEWSSHKPSGNCLKPAALFRHTDLWVNTPPTHTHTHKAMWLPAYVLTEPLCIIYKQLWLTGLDSVDWKL